jgi:hypothetical protein
MSHAETNKPLFSLGRIVTTPGALHALHDARHRPGEFLARHVTGDWGDLDDEDRNLNNAAVIDGSRILSAYTSRKGERIWVITEAVNEVGLRYCTTLLLASEY